MIGKAGATINNIRNTCNVKIEIPAREDIQHQSNVDIKIISSSQQDIDRAKAMIREANNRSSSYGQPRRDDYNSERSSSAKRPHSQNDEYQDKRWNKSHNDESKYQSDNNPVN